VGNDRLQSVIDPFFTRKPVCRPFRARASGVAEAIANLVQCKTGFNVHTAIAIDSCRSAACSGGDWFARPFFINIAIKTNE
jgi:hypothetical protein